MSQYTYPENIELSQIQQTYLGRMVAESAAFSIFPRMTSEATTIKWEQLDNYYGLTQIRGINGSPSSVKKTGIRQYSCTPGYYGEYESIDEAEILDRRKIATFGTPINLEELVMIASNKLMQRQVARQEKMIWDLLGNGFFSVSDAKGAVLHTDQYTQRIYTAATPWSATTSATPLQNFRDIMLLSRGYSVRFDQAATVYVNRKQANYLLQNSNPADFGGKKILGGNTVNSMEQLNSLLTGEGLPQFAVEDGGYLDETTGNYTLYIPDGTAILVGQRAGGVPVGNMVTTPNLMNPGFGPGEYYKVVIREDDIPYRYQVHRGFNAALALKFPSAIVRMAV